LAGLSIASHSPHAPPSRLNFQEGIKGYKSVVAFVLRDDLSSMGEQSTIRRTTDIADFNFNHILAGSGTADHVSVISHGKLLNWAPFGEAMKLRTVLPLEFPSEGLLGKPLQRFL
jgi:hypothetical protein